MTVDSLSLTELQLQYDSNQTDPVETFKGFVCRQVNAMHADVGDDAVWVYDDDDGPMRKLTDDELRAVIDALNADELRINHPAFAHDPRRCEHSLDTLVRSDLDAGLRERAAMRLIQWVAHQWCSPRVAFAAVPDLTIAEIEAGEREITTLPARLVNMMDGQPGVVTERQKLAKLRRGADKLKLHLENSVPGSVTPTAFRDIRKRLGLSANVMAPLFFDGDRLVTEFSMFWIASTDAPTHWAIYDTEGNSEIFATKAEARARLARYAAEETAHDPR